MSVLAIWIPVFVISLVILVKAADYFIDSAEKIGSALKINPFIIGVTIVALGTSLPELITSLIAVFKDSTEIVIGNVVGSNIANFGLVMAFVAIVSKKINLKFDVLIVEIPFFLGSAFLVSIMMIDGVFDLWDGIIACIGMILFLVYTLRGNKSNIDELDDESEKTKLPAATIVVFILSGVAIYLSAEYNIRAVLKIAEELKIGTEVVAQTAVALGTSLPELLVSYAAAKRNNIEIAVGNLIGSNIFNSFAVLGIPALIKPLIVPPEMLVFSVPLMLVLSMLFFIMMITNKVNRWQGYLLLLCYVFFIMTIIKDAIV
ncbi:MAG: calcium/sodium antiporter [Bacteroidetes bacterium]|nr:calcium/sodium antiporter [Bacteroidota bacterium]